MILSTNISIDSLNHAVGFEIKYAKVGSFINSLKAIVIRRKLINPLRAIAYLVFQI